VDKRYLALGAGVGIGAVVVLAVRARRRGSLLGSVGIAPPTPTRLLIEQRERTGKGRVSPVTRWRETRETVPPEKRGRHQKQRTPFIPEEYEGFVAPFEDLKLQEEMIGNFTVDRGKFIKQLVPRKIPKHLIPYADFMVKSSKRPVSPRQLVTAYLLTTGSMMRSAVKPATVLEHVPYAKVGTAKVRPEDVLAQILRSPDGKAYLAAAAKGRYNAKAARKISKQYAWAGLRHVFAKQLRAAPQLALEAGKVTKILRNTATSRDRTASRLDWYKFVKKNMSGVSTAKAGFVASMLGRGDMATADAREINFWWCPPGKYNADRPRCSISMQKRYGCANSWATSRSRCRASTTPSSPTSRTTCCGKRSKGTRHPTRRSSTR
jgi:hypothetical protein